jgi:hypothetical protein
MAWFYPGRSGLRRAGVAAFGEREWWVSVALVPAWCMAPGGAFLALHSGALIPEDGVLIEAWQEPPEPGAAATGELFAGGVFAELAPDTQTFAPGSPACLAPSRPPNRGEMWAFGYAVGRAWARSLPGGHAPE